MTEKKTIGIPGYIDASSKNSFGVGINYLEWISTFGNPRIIMPWEDVVDIDLLILPGGLDTNPTNYNQTPGFKTSNQDVFKEHFFTQKVPKYIEKEIPIFGICLGMQQLASYFGCKLAQNLPWHAQSPDRWETAHMLYGWSHKEQKFLKTKIHVNSHHHQGVYYNKEIFDSQIEAIYLSNDGTNRFIIEAFKVKDRSIYAVQWHPEELYDADSTYFVNTLLNLNKQ